MLVRCVTCSLSAASQLCSALKCQRNASDVSDMTDRSSFIAALWLVTRHHYIWQALVGVCFCIPISVQVLVPWLVAMKQLESTTSDNSFEGFLVQRHSWACSTSHRESACIIRDVLKKRFYYSAVFINLFSSAYTIQGSATIEWEYILNRLPVCHRVVSHPHSHFTHILDTCSQFKMKLVNLNPRMTLHCWKQHRLDLNPGRPCCKAKVVTAVPPCCSFHNAP